MSSMPHPRLTRSILSGGVLGACLLASTAVLAQSVTTPPPTDAPAASVPEAKPEGHTEAKPAAEQAAPVSLPKATSATLPGAASTTAGALIPAPAAPAAPVIDGAPSPAPSSPATPEVKAAAAKVKKRASAPTSPREFALSTDPNPSLTSETFFSTVKASERYSAIADAGGWPDIPAPLAPGASGKAVATLRLRLAIEGDLKSPGHGGQAAMAGEGAGLFDTRWTPELTAAVKRFQLRHGLRDTGAVSGATLKAMNVPARVRFTELASSAQRLAGRQFNFGDRYVAVNLPSASVEAVENGQVVRRYTAIVGNPEHASPEVDTKVVAVNVNPTWTVPTSIIKNEIIPKMQKDPGYLSRNHIRILDGAGNTVNPSSINWSTQRAANYILRQDSGKANSLGAIRINMPNKFAVYMHDTPGKGLFGADDRFLSHGCVRVQGVNDLAAWLLKDSLGSPDGGIWTGEAIEQKIAEGQHEEIRLSKAVPVAWVYMTGWANGDGVANFRDDVYGIDTVGAATEARVDPKLLPNQAQ